MDITRELILNSDPPILYYSNRPYGYCPEKVIDNMLWIWNKIKQDFKSCEWYVLNLSPKKSCSIDQLLQSIPHIVSRVSGVIDPKATRRGWTTPFYFSLERPDDNCYGEHFHCLLRGPGGISNHQTRTISRKLRQMKIFTNGSRSVNIRPLCPSGFMIQQDIMKTLHYHAKQSTLTNDPYAYHKQ